MNYNKELTKLADRWLVDSELKLSVSYCTNPNGEDLIIAFKDAVKTLREGLKEVKEDNSKIIAASDRLLDVAVEAMSLRNVLKPLCVSNKQEKTEPKD